MIEDFRLFGGLHCETSAVRKVFLYNDLQVSEEMLLGLAGGIGFIYWYMKQMPAPIVGGRGGGRYFIENLGKRTGAKIQPQRTGSAKRGYTMLMERLAAGQPTVIYADMAYLPYMGVPEEAHFGQHVIVVYGIDEEADLVKISDRGKRGVTVNVNDLKRARGSKFPLWPPQHALFDIQLPKKLQIGPKVVRQALHECINGMLNPPISNLGLKGFQKWANLLLKWPDMFQGMNLWGCLMNVFIFIETGGTGGSSMRPMFSRFLAEAKDILKLPKLDLVIERYQESARIWSKIAELILPDSYPALGKARELLWEKDRVFIEQEPGATEKLLELNRKTDDIMDGILEEVKQAPKFLPEVQPFILKLHEVEKDAIQLLARTIG
ncbi:MAG: BtrH N-terminal domain-containing protein [Promethearchaeota archaeon]